MKGLDGLGDYAFGVSAPASAAGNLAKMPILLIIWTVCR
jgi:hypothetical protein